MIAKAFSLIFFTALLFFGSFRSLLLIFLESSKLIVIYALWKILKAEETIYATSDFFQMTQVFTVVSELAHIQHENESLATIHYEDETVFNRLAKMDGVDEIQNLHV